MIEINLASSELGKLERELKATNVLLVKRVSDALRLGAFSIEGIAKKKIQKGTRSGTVYRIGKGKRTHTASAAGEPPKSNTGRLVSSIRTNSGFLKSEVGSDHKYAACLEDGTSRMEKRPWLKPSLEEAKPGIDKLLQKALKKAFK